VKPAGQEEKESFSKDPSQALEEIMCHYGTMVLKTAYFYMGDRHHAEDMSQEVFVRVYHNWLSFRGDSSVKTWLTTITRNVCRDKLGLKMSSEEPVEFELICEAHTVNVEDEAMRRLSQTVVLKHVLKLPMVYHEVVYLYYYLDLSTVEIANAIKVPEGTVRGRLHRAREMLGDYLRGEGLDS
jgi:RNA polymerase sigma-70 factor (ECF subfamily)